MEVIPTRIVTKHGSSSTSFSTLIYICVCKYPYLCMNRTDELHELTKLMIICILSGIIFFQSTLSCLIESS